MPSYTTITKCRLCGHSELESLYILGEHYVNGFPAPDQHPGEPCPIDIVMCRQCDLVQQQHSAPQEILYSRHYWYRSGVTQTMRDALREITAQIESMVDLKPGDIILDIGSNDGTLLRSYSKEGLFRVGVEPASNLQEEGRVGLNLLINDFWDYEKYINHNYQIPGMMSFMPFTLSGRQDAGKAKVITAIGMFYDLEDPNKFIADVAKALRQDGIFVCQLMCLKQMIQSKDIGNLAHEHLEFYSLANLELLFHMNGLEIFDLSENNVNGGSYRIFARHKTGKWDFTSDPVKRIHAALRTEEDMELDCDETHFQFFEELERAKATTVRFIKQKVQMEHKTVCVYGASTKGNTILQYYGLNEHLIKCAAERSPEKWGKVTVGTNIPIVSEEEARALDPDYFLVLPFAFIDEFIEREKDNSWRRRGGKFIVPIPEMRLV